MAVHLIGSLLLKAPVGALLLLISWGRGKHVLNGKYVAQKIGLGEWRKTNAALSTKEKQNVLIGFVRRQKQVLPSGLQQRPEGSLADLWYDLHWQQIIRLHKGLQKE